MAIDFEKILQLELNKAPVVISYKDFGKVIQTRGIIRAIVEKEGQEFILLETGLALSIDSIVYLDRDDDQK